jgi:hypothetical protein
MVDNQPAIALALTKNPVLHDRRKHINIPHIVTKPLGCLRFSELKNKIGMVELKSKE